MMRTAARRLEDACKAKLKSELRDSSVVQGLSGKKTVLELDGVVSSLELQAQNLLLESGTGGQEDNGSLMASSVAALAGSAEGPAHRRAGKGTKRRK
jgi:hypothetical protein